jgi:hypothetical protein
MPCSTFSSLSSSTSSSAYFTVRITCPPILIDTPPTLKSKSVLFYPDSVLCVSYLNSIQQMSFVMYKIVFSVRYKIGS